MIEEAIRKLVAAESIDLHGGGVAQSVRVRRFAVVGLT